MAKKKVVQKVKTPAGYDIINPLTPWQVQHCSFAPTSTASLYKISTMTPPENLAGECLAIFKPTVTNAAGVEVEVNGVNFGSIKWNGASIAVGVIPANQYVSIYIDFVNKVVQLVTPTGIINSKATTATYSVTLTTVWNGSGPYTQTVAVSGILSSDNPMADIVLSADAETARSEVEAWGMVSQIKTFDGEIMATCLDSKPDVAIPIQLKVVR